MTTVPVRSASTAPHELSAFTLESDAQAVIAGGVVSTTVSVAVQVVVLPLASAAVIVIVFGPRAAGAPAAGDCVTVVTAQLSVATTPLVKSGTLAEQFPLASSVRPLAQVVIAGAVVSCTV